GALGSIMLIGVQRGLFSNEAGIGSVPNAAATASASHPAKQGFVQALGVYFDTILVCSITAFIILLSTPDSGSSSSGFQLTRTAPSALRPAKPGFVQALGVYFDTILVCSITAFIILLSNPEYGSSAEGIQLTQTALSGQLGQWAIHFLTLAIFLFAFSSILGNY